MARESRAAAIIRLAESTRRVRGGERKSKRRAAPVPATAPTSPPAAINPKTRFASLTSKCSAAMSQNWTKATEEKRPAQM